jgi:hypothetical protein
LSLLNQNINNIYCYDKHINYIMSSAWLLFVPIVGLYRKKIYLSFRLCVHIEAHSLAVLKHYTGYNAICLYNNFIELWNHHICYVLQLCRWTTENWNKMGTHFSHNIDNFIPPYFTSSVSFMLLPRSLLSLLIIYTVR